MTAGYDRVTWLHTGVSESPEAKAISFFQAVSIGTPNQRFRNDTAGPTLPGELSRQLDARDRRAIPAPAPLDFLGL